MDKEDSFISRRDFIRASAGVGVMGLLGCGAWGALEYTLSDANADRWERDICRYCGCGCGLLLGFKGEELKVVRGDPESSTKGFICIKGSYLPALYSKEFTAQRLTSPKVRKNGVLVDVSWDEAIQYVAETFTSLIKEYGKDAVSFYGSGQLLTEESYTANKFFKAGIGTNNVDGNPRLCMASAAVGYTSTFGKDEPCGGYADLDVAKCFFILGANMFEAHPPLFERILVRKKQDPSIRIICVDPRLTKTAKYSDIHLAINPGTDMLLLNAMLHVIMKNKWYDTNFINNHITWHDGKNPITMEDFIAFLEDYAPSKVEVLLDIPASTIEEVAWIFAKSPATTSLWTMGANQRTQGTFINNTLSSLHLVTGQICRPGATPLSLTGQGNACGGVRDTGTLAHLLPNGRLVANANDRAEMEKLWNVPAGTISPNPGLSAIDMFKAMADGRIKACLCMCTNPGQSLPNLNFLRKGLEKAFLVVSDIVETETTKLADVILPAALWIKRDGVKGQTERRYQRVRKLKEPLAGTKSDLDILVAIAHAMGYKDLITATTPHAVWEEYRVISATSKYNFAGITYERMEKEHGLQWPCPTPTSPGTPIRYLAGVDPIVPEGKQGVYFYGKPDGKAWVFARPYIPAPEQRSKEYPFILTTGRVIQQWHTGTMTMQIPELAKAVGRSRLYVHPVDANALGLKTNDLVEVSSTYGSLRMQVQVSDETKIGVVFSSFYDAQSLINDVVTDAYDPFSKQPEYKITAVSIVRV